MTYAAIIFIIHPYGGLGIYYGDTSTDWVGVLGDIMGVNQAEDMVISGNYAFTVQFYDLNDESLVSMDISDPPNTKLVGYLPVNKQANRITSVKNGLLDRHGQS